VVRFLENDEKMMMKRSVSVSTYPKSNAKSQTKLVLGCFAEQLLKLPKLEIDTLGYDLTVLHPWGQGKKQ
jgi:hypothetical protein